MISVLLRILLGPFHDTRGILDSFRTYSEMSLDYGE